MAKSAAKKMRDKAVREGKRNPECGRSPFVFTDMRSRKTKTKKDYLYRSKNKNLNSEEGRKDGSFYYTYLRDLDYNAQFILPGLQFISQ